MAPETEDILSSAENNIIAAVRLLYHACGEQSGLAIAMQLVEDSFRFETARREKTPFLPGLYLH